MGHPLLRHGRQWNAHLTIMYRCGHDQTTDGDIAVCYIQVQLMARPGWFGAFRIALGSYGAIFRQIADYLLQDHGTLALQTFDVFWVLFSFPGTPTLAFYRCRPLSLRHRLLTRLNDGRISGNMPCQLLLIAVFDQ